MGTGKRGMPASVVEYLRLHHIITLSTSSFTGMPHADTVVYTNDDRNIYFYAIEGSILTRNIEDSHRVSFTIDDYTTDWRKVRELQGIGRCESADDPDEWTELSSKFGSAFSGPAGSLYRLTPHEMHFVDYDYATVAAKTEPEVTQRTFQIDSAPSMPSRGALATSLDRSVFEAGQIIFRPGDGGGQYYVVVEGEVEIRAEGYGADQTVVRVGPGQMFGDQGTLRGQRGALTAHAVSPTTLMAVEREAMRDLLMDEDDGKEQDGEPTRKPVARARTQKPAQKSRARLGTKKRR